MELHHHKHHRAYVDAANKALELLQSADPSNGVRLAGIQSSLVFNASGHVLHSLFWESLSPETEEPDGELLAAIEESFGSKARMNELLTATAKGVPGSGWGALVWDATSERLHVSAVQDHHQHQLSEASALAVIDVWEHAYYLQYRNDRAAWVEQAVDHIAWAGVATRLAAIRERATV